MVSGILRVEKFWFRVKRQELKTSLKEDINLIRVSMRKNRNTS